MSIAPLQIQLVDFERVSTTDLASMASPWMVNGKTSNANLRQKQAARAALSLLVNLSSEKLIENKQWGYYTLEGSTGRRFVSFTHTKTLAAAAVSDFPIGIDLENISRDATRVMERICSPAEMILTNEQSLIDGQLIPNSILLWTAKEALAKASGVGLRHGMDKLEIVLRGAQPFDACIHAGGPLHMERPGIVFRTWKDHVLALCQSFENLFVKSINLLIYPQP